MTLAVVKAERGDQTILATLTEDGWSVPGAAVLERLLNLAADPDDFGPALGDPTVNAAKTAAEMISGTVAYVRDPDPAPPDAVF